MSNTKINLEYPYNKVWNTGYLVTNSENRQTLLLYNSHKDRSSTQYARYLLSVKLGRFLDNNETVDHIDGDKTNDCINNLQLLSLSENIIKTHKKPDIDLECPVCKIIFTKTRTQLRGKWDRAKTNSIACSRICGGKLSHFTKNTR